MSNAEKLLEKMRNNPRDWRIESLQTVARAYEIAWRQQGTSHVVFVPRWTNLTSAGAPSNQADLYQEVCCLCNRITYARSKALSI